MNFLHAANKLLKKGYHPQKK